MVLIINMGATLSVFKLINPNKEKLMKGVNSNPQLTFQDLDLKDELGEARSNLKFFDYDETNNKVKYNAIHYTETISNPIRVYLDDIEDSFSNIPKEIITQIKKGTKNIQEYQEIHKFEVIIDFKTNEVFVFANKKIANAFMRRFKRNGLIEYKKVYFNLSKVDDIPELANIWGCWESCQGKCKKKAYFGTEVNKIEGIKKEQVTSYNVEYEYDSDTIVDLFIAIECRISSKSSLMTNAELFRTYQELKKSLGADIKEDSSTEAFQEEE